METKQSQIKINLPLKLKKKVEARAEKYDMTLAGYTKHLMVMDLNNKETLVYQLSESSLRAIKQSKKDIKEGKYSTIKSKTDLKNFLNSL